MITFLPIADLAATAAVLDNQRLGKQRIEAYQILNHIKKGKVTHPVVRIWAKNPHGLAAYGVAICIQWMGLGFKDSMVDRITDLYDPRDNDMPYWFGMDRFHSAHRATLLHKNFEWYSQFGWTEKPFPGYWWPDAR